MYGSDIAETFHRAQRADGRSPRSITTYRKVIRRFGQYQFAHDKTLLATTQEDLIDYRCSLMDEHLAERTQHLYSVVLNVFFGWCVNEGHLEQSPAARLRRLKAVQSVATPPRQEDFERLVFTIGHERPEDFRDRAIFLVLLASGMRISELCSLKVDQIDFETGEFEIRGKGGYRRLGMISGRALAALCTWVCTWRQELTKDVNGWLWISSTGGRYTPKRVREMMERRRLAAGIDSRISYASGASKSVITPHAIRHLHATMMLQAGVSLPVIQASLGHKSLETTQIYLDISAADLRRSRACFDGPSTPAMAA